MGDYLIVGVTTEQYDAFRGKLNVVDPLITRVDNVRKCGFADEVIIEDHEGQKMEDIQRYNIDIFTVGSDWRGKFDYLKEYCEVIYLERTKDVSSTLLRRERHGIIRIGIIGSGRIAGRFIPEAKYVSGVSVAGVYNPRLAGAQQLADRYELSLASDDLDAFLEQVEAVYIASPHQTHYDYTRKALEAGKHVLCEKPMVLYEQEARELFALAIQKGLVLMEAIKTAYAPGFINLLAMARSGRIGRIYDVEASFTKMIPPNPTIREYHPEIGGSFTELGSYPLMPIVKLLGRNYREVQFHSVLGENGVDIYTKAQFAFDNAVATAKTGIGVKSEGQLLISGTGGYILAKSPWWLPKTFEVCFENVEENELYSAPFPGFGLRYEIAEFARNIGEGEENNHKFSPGDSILQAGVMERFLQWREGEGRSKEGGTSCENTF